MRALVLHVLGDALGNVGVIATGLTILYAPASWNGREVYFDPAISLVIAFIILGSAVPLGESPFRPRLLTALMGMYYSAQRVLRPPAGRTGDDLARAGARGDPRSGGCARPT